MMNRFKLYRWYKGGIWIYYYGVWAQADKDGYVRIDSCGFHYTLHGINKREIYK